MRANNWDSRSSDTEFRVVSSGEGDKHTHLLQCTALVLGCFTGLTILALGRGPVATGGMKINYLTQYRSKYDLSMPDG